MKSKVFLLVNEGRADTVLNQFLRDCVVHYSSSYTLNGYVCNVCSMCAMYVFNMYNVCFMLYNVCFQHTLHIIYSHSHFGVVCLFLMFYDLFPQNQ